eukprot:gene13339-17891_t
MAIYKKRKISQSITSSIALLKHGQWEIASENQNNRLDSKDYTSSSSSDSSYSNDGFKRIRLVNSSTESLQKIDEDLDDDSVPSSEARLAQSNVKLLVRKWIKVIPIPPMTFFAKLLSSRGYSTESQCAMEIYRRNRVPSDEQLQSYQSNIITAVKFSDRESLKRCSEEGISLSACNKFSESILHMACRRSTFTIVEFLINNNADINVVDDCGKTPLHDACWRADPQFDITTLLLDTNPSLILLKDIRGFTPLQYVPEAAFKEWCAFIYYQQDRYWPRSTNNTNSSK